MRVALASFVLVAALCATARAAPVLPDLVADPPVGGNAPIVYSDTSGSRLLLRMDGFVHNRGPGRLELRGSAPSERRMTSVVQRVYDSGRGFVNQPVTAPQLLYETDDDHDHWHLRNAMRYSLWSEDRTVEVAPSQKVGFCLLDSEPIEAPANSAPFYTDASKRFCETGRPTVSSVFMGISPGWRDVYPYVLAFQWVDISDVAPGRYWLRADADPDGVVIEADEVNPPAYDAEISIVNGWRADPVAAGSVPATGTTEIALAATRFDDVHLGDPGPRQFQVVTPPAGGTLDQPAGAWFDAASVRYTPNPGFSGADTFTVAARDATSPFPRNPRSAAVTLSVQAPEPPPEPGVLGISGAPDSVLTSSATQLTASGPGVEQGVTWTASAGTIGPDGLYRAPASVPAGGRVTVSAASATGARGSVSFAVRAAPDPRPAPDLKPPPVPDRGLSRIKLRLHEGSLLAVVSSAQRGRVRFDATLGGRRFGGCAMRIRRGGAATCNVPVPVPSARASFLCRISRTVEAAPAQRIAVRARLTRGDRRLAERKAVLKP